MENEGKKEKERNYLITRLFDTNVIQTDYQLIKKQLTAHELRMLTHLSLAEMACYLALKGKGMKKEAMREYVCSVKKMRET